MKKIKLIYTDGETNINFEEKYNVKSKNIFYNRNLNIVYGDNEALIEDFDQNFYILKENFKINLLEKILKSNKSIILDKNFNKYIFDDLLINLEKNEIIGNEIKIEFENSYFGNEKNDPILRGRSGYSNDNELKVYKAAFSTCNLKDKNAEDGNLIQMSLLTTKKKKYSNIETRG